MEKVGGRDKQELNYMTRSRIRSFSRQEGQRGGEGYRGGLWGTGFPTKQPRNHNNDGPKTAAQKKKGGYAALRLKPGAKGKGGEFQGAFRGIKAW